MKKVRHNNSLIETDFVPDIDFYSYITDNWIDSNIAWRREIIKATYDNSLMNKFFHQPLLKPYDKVFIDLLEYLQKEFNFKTEDYRFSFFKVEKGGSMKPHTDQRSKASFLIPVTNNISSLVVENKKDTIKISYKTMVVLNTTKTHSVEEAVTDRIIFHIGIHDIKFEDLKVE